MRNIVVTKVGKESVTDIEAFRHYRNNAKHRDVDYTNSLHKYKKIVNALYGKVANGLIDNDGGVFIKNLGYFSIIMHPKKQMVRVPYQKEEFANFRTNNYLFMPTFFGVTKGNPLLNFWVMDRSFSRTKVKQRLHKALLAGKKYKTYVSTISSLYLFKK
jgi:hypothetical protein